MLLARSPEERLTMGCSMSATARALVRASVLAQDPHASSAALRRALFLRFYGRVRGAGARAGSFPPVDPSRAIAGSVVGQIGPRFLSFSGAWGGGGPLLGGRRER